METLTIAQLIKKIEELDAHFEKCGMKRDNAIEFKYAHNAKYQACFTIYSPYSENAKYQACFTIYSPYSEDEDKEWE